MKDTIKIIENNAVKAAIEIIKKQNNILWKEPSKQINRQKMEKRRLINYL